MTEDLRSKKIVFVSHCLLNTNIKANGAAHWPTMPPLLMAMLNKHELGIEQMPCPELGMFDIGREKRTKELYDAPEFRKVCAGYSLFVTREIEKFIKARQKIMAIIGVAGSPSCGTKLVTSGKTIKAAKRILGQGIFIEELQKSLKARNLDIPFVDFDSRDIHKSISEIESKIKMSELQV